MIKRIALLIEFLALITLACDHSTLSLKSPDGSVSVNLYLHEGVPGYMVYSNNEVVLDSSVLGVVFDGVDLSKEMKLIDESSVSAYSDSYSLLHGKQKNIVYEANEKTFRLVHENGTKLEITFRVSNDGVAFQYKIEGDDEEIHYISEEKTSFNFRQYKK